MPTKGKILPRFSATWFLSLGGRGRVGCCWGWGRVSHTPPCPPVGASSHGQRDRAGGGQIQRDVSQGDGEWEFVPQQAKSQAGMNTRGCPITSWDCRVLRVSEHAAATVV